MLKIWGRTTSSNVQKVMWAVAELGLAHERVDAGGAFGGLDTAEYGAMNPNRLVPTVDDGGTVLWESNAIVRYLAVKYGEGTLAPRDLGERARADRWMDWQISTIGPNWGRMFLGLVRTPPSKRNMAEIDAAVERLGESYRILDAQLAGRDYIMGDHLTMADIPLGVSLYRYYELDVKRPSLPNVEAWYARLKARPAYAKHAMVPFASLMVSD
ncbi:MAG: glutathione S-transferase [Ectothiorhodospiraceae bacterium]|nr:glutathione S-transferase [Ectothiorhodospiraceae bacterium]